MTKCEVSLKQKGRISQKSPEPWGAPKKAERAGATSTPEFAESPRPLHLCYILHLPSPLGVSNGEEERAGGPAGIHGAPACSAGQMGGTRLIVPRLHRIPSINFIISSLWTLRSSVGGPQLSALPALCRPSLRPRPHFLSFLGLSVAFFTLLH